MSSQHTRPVLQLQLRKVLAAVPPPNDGSLEHAYAFFRARMLTYIAQLTDEAEDVQSIKVLPALRKLQPNASAAKLAEHGEHARVLRPIKEYYDGFVAARGKEFRAVRNAISNADRESKRRHKDDALSKTAHRARALSEYHRNQDIQRR